MMRIGVISDTHGDLDMARKAIDQMGPVDMILHAGDTYEDMLALSEDVDADMIGVWGNIGHNETGQADEIIEAEGVRILLTHGHRYGVKQNLMRLYYRMKETGADVVVFGHTHVAMAQWEDGMLFLNPGSVGFPRGPFSNSYAILDISGAEASAEILEIV